MRKLARNHMRHCSNHSRPEAFKPTFGCAACSPLLSSEKSSMSHPASYDEVQDWTMSTPMSMLSKAKLSLSLSSQSFSSICRQWLVLCFPSLLSSRGDSARLYAMTAIFSQGVNPSLPKLQFRLAGACVADLSTFSNSEALAFSGLDNYGRKTWVNGPGHGGLA